MIDHAKHKIDTYGNCGQWIGHVWVADYKWWYLKIWEKVGWSAAWSSWKERGLLPSDADELAVIEPV